MMMNTISKSRYRFSLFFMIRPSRSLPISGSVVPIFSGSALPIFVSALPNFGSLPNLGVEGFGESPPKQNPVATEFWIRSFPLPKKAGIG